MKYARVMNIRTSDHTLLVYFNTGKSYWKKKPFLHIFPNADMYYDLKESMVEIDNLYYRYDHDRELLPLRDYPGVLFV